MKLQTTLICLATLFYQNSYTQNWTTEIKEKDFDKLTFPDLQTAFNKFYRLKENKDKIDFVFSAEGLISNNNSLQSSKYIEEYNLFKRWEWYLRPRIYKIKHLELNNILGILDTLTLHDNNMIFKSGGAPAAGPRVADPPQKWKPLGPFDAINDELLGRVNCIEVDPRNPDIIFLGTPNGGIWKTTNGGVAWTPIFDDQMTLSISDIAIDPQNSSTVYAATSDGFGYALTDLPFWGGTYSIGVLKSLDGGTNWTVTGLNWTVEDNITIRRLVVDPTNNNILLAATSNGLFRTNDAGVSWKKIWNENTFDIEFRHDNGNIVYVTTGEVFKSTDAGITFSKLPAPCVGARYNIEISRSNPNTLYTLCAENNNPNLITANVLKSIDGGTTWVPTTMPGTTLYGYYDNVLMVSPKDENVVYVAGFDISKSADGGKTWQIINTAGHVDNHCIKFLPGNDEVILCGNDGGIFKSTDKGKSWKSLNKSLSISQLYNVGLSAANPSLMLCGLQDNGNVILEGSSFRDIKVQADGMGGFIDWNNPDIIYFSIQNGTLYRSNNRGNTFKLIKTPSPGDWVTPWCQHPKDNKTIFAATNKVYKSTNQGDSWTSISGSLVPGYFTVLEISSFDPNVIYAGDGRNLFVTKNAGANWKQITGGLPVATNYLTDVAINENNADICYVTFSGYNVGKKVYRTEDAGKTWKNISGGLPNIPVNCAEYDNNNRNGIYVGTDAGIYYLSDKLSDWVPYKQNLPNVIVNDISVDRARNRVVAATYGRGLWEGPLSVL